MQPDRISSWLRKGIIKDDEQVASPGKLADFSFRHRYNLFDYLQEKVRRSLPFTISKDRYNYENNHLFGRITPWGVVARPISRVMTERWLLIKPAVFMRRREDAEFF